MIRLVLILVTDPDFLPIRYPGVYKAPDPGSESATLVFIKKGIKIIFIDGVPNFCQIGSAWWTLKFKNQKSIALDDHSHADPI
jgi:hypothetical protein